MSILEERLEKEKRVLKEALDTANKSVTYEKTKVESLRE